MALPNFQRTAVTDEGDIIPNADVTVRSQATGTTITIYSDREGTTTKDNPFVTDVDGFVEFYADPQLIKVEVVGGGGTVEWTDFELIQSPTSTTDNTPGRLVEFGSIYQPVSVAGTEYTISDDDSYKNITFNLASDCEVKIPASLTQGVQVTTNNIGGGGVSFVMLSSEVLKGNPTLTDSSGIMGAMKVSSTVWQSTER